LTLILAATPSLGIGYAGQLPWPMLKSEMAYFARVTKRVPPLPTTSSTTTTTTTTTASIGTSPSVVETEKKRINAVIMGRKTWESIPLRFRPLPGRLNVVVSRSGVVDTGTTSGAKGEGERKVEGPVVVGSLVDAISVLSSASSLTNVEVARAFVIGGGTLYKAALELPQTDRVLLTKIKREYECDTFFPVDLDSKEGGWAKATKQELEEFVGEAVPEEGIVEKEVGFEFGMYAR
ncbi:dihydrofolate reductase, partial [Delitschia confertaspora ATCC 74209]